MGDRPEILYVHNGATTFVVNDKLLLETAYVVHEMPFVTNSPWMALLLAVRQIPSCMLLMSRVKAVVCQFAGHHSVVPVLMAKLFRKRVIILSNGSDCVSFPSLDYGHFRKPLLAATTRMSFKSCDLIVPLHPTLALTEPTYHDIDGHAQGILHYCPGLSTPIHPLGYGFDPNKWRARGQRIMNRFITVASNAHLPRIQVIKGLDMIVRVAERFPEHEFLIVGARQGALPGKPSNVVEVPYVPNHELPDLYGTATYYLQLSVSEGFGNALCEAMLCGCVPIVSNVGAMPDIVGDTGVVVPKRDVNVLEQYLRRAIALDVGIRAARARERIIQDRPIETRRSGLIAAVEGVVVDAPIVDANEGRTIR